MSTAHKSIEVAAPRACAYALLTQFENYPQFMAGLASITPVDASTFHLVLDIGEDRAVFNARIVEAWPGRFVCWEAINGPQISMTLRLEAIADSATRVVADLQIDARELMPDEEHVDEVLDQWLTADLTGFKRFCEASAATSPATYAAASSATPE